MIFRSRTGGDVCLRFQREGATHPVEHRVLTISSTGTVITDQDELDWPGLLHMLRLHDALEEVVE